MVELLLHSGTDVNKADHLKTTALHHATVNEHHKVVELLLKHDAKPLVKDCKGNTPLDYAHEGGDKTNIGLLEDAIEQSKIIGPPID